MGFYDKHILPKVLNWTCGMKPVQKQRQKVVPLAEGCVLEIGIGSGLNLPYYDPEKIERVIGCQRRSKISPPGRSKTSPLNVMRYAVLGGCPGSP